MGSPHYRCRFCPLKQKVIVLIPMSVRVWGSVRDGEALHDSVPSWQHSLWPDTGGRGKRAKEEEGNGGAERGGAGSICKAGCESPQGERRRGEEKTAQWRENWIRLSDWYPFLPGVNDQEGSPLSGGGKTADRRRRRRTVGVWKLLLGGC